MVTVILSKHKRTHLLPEQILAIQSQTHKVDEILFDDSAKIGKGVWERFNLARTAKNKFVCIIDDDTIPGKKYIESCINEFKIKEGVYGTKGVIFKSNSHYEGNYEEVGWYNPNSKTTQVDYCCHSWFFLKDWLEYFWRAKEVPFNYGEDMNLSFQLQREGINTYVPPHPKNDKELWGSIKGREYGDDENSLWVSNPLNFRNNMFEYFNTKVNEGWRLLRDKTSLM